MEERFNELINNYKGSQEDSEAIDIIDFGMEDPKNYVKVIQWVSKMNQEEALEFIKKGVISLVEDVAEGYGDESWPLLLNGNPMVHEEALQHWHKLKAFHNNILKAAKPVLMNYVIISGLISRLWYSEIRRTY